MARGIQLKRQWQILLLLQNNRFGIGIDQITSELDCSRRTIERDLSNLKEIGFPVSCEEREFGKKFWKIERGFLSSDKLLIEPTEIIGLYLANQYLANNPYSKGLIQLWKKVSKFLPVSALNYFSDLGETIYIKNATGTPSCGQDHLYLIQDAINKKQILELKYEASKGKDPFSMMFHPYGLVLLGNISYIVGHSEYAKEERTLKLQRIKEVRLTKKKFSVPKDFSLNKRFKGSFGIMYSNGKAVTIRCKFSHYAAQRIREEKWHSTQVIEKDNVDSLIASFLLNNTTEFKGWIMSLGSQVTVLEPLDFRKEVEDNLKATLKNYKT